MCSLLDHDLYLLSLAGFSLLVTCVWAPLFLQQWDRKEAHLKHKWGWNGDVRTTRVNPRHSGSQNSCIKSLLVLVSKMAVLTVVGVAVLLRAPLAIERGLNRVYLPIYRRW